MTALPRPLASRPAHFDTTILAMAALLLGMMVAGGPAGANQFVAVVSERPRDFSEAGLVAVDPFAEFPLDSAATIAAANQGGQSPFLGKPVCPAGGTASGTSSASIARSRR